MIKLGFIGAGTVGTALAVRLRERGYPVVAAASRTPASARRLAEMVPGCRVYDEGQGVADEAELVFITTPDDALAGVAAQVRWHPGQGVVHTSGACSLDVLEPARRLGAQVGAIHPLQTFASIQQAIENLPGSTFALEAQGELLDKLRDIARALGGDIVELRAGDRVLYHAAAVFACNYWVTLVKLAADLWGGFGVPTDQAVKALIPLLRGTLNNLAQVGLPQALTGPIARGDVGTIKRHIEALERKAPELLSTYRELGLQTLPIALTKGRVDEKRAQEIRKILEGVKP